MTTSPLIAVLAGAREVHDAVAWLNAAQARACVVWGREGEAVPLGLSEHATVPADTRAIVDVSHAFDVFTRIGALAAVPHAAYARVGRDPWMPGAGEKWQQVNTMEQAVAALPAGARVFAATGRGSLTELARHRGRVFLRQLTAHREPTGFGNCEFVFGSAPLDAAGEAELLKRLEIDVVLARNIGGPDAFPKVQAARDLGLPVVMLRPPALPSGPRLRSAEQMADWLKTL
ncbi:precorrin-6A/cobalt-precorrin-6A reductase [uncultured Tateyamaria sp.]|uniref:precorrin-6A/cobalt-precorrin-6A reductase n=1 Tax=uncultured Tateyamaria sp. TaxID=455651 RepID=UPI002634BEF3|nr:precorrin-6A/cobalt-precorrin-6A reductase [uncultured Tateyamaria sp.]